MDELTPTCWIIAGPNGAGKTTFALEYLPDVANCENFINADLIAAGLSPLAPEKELITASRLFLQEIKTYTNNKKNFAFETTLSGRSYLKLIKQLKNAGWQVELFYLALPNIEICKKRVAERVAHGGHNIPAKDIERRFARSLHNLFSLFAEAASRTRCFINNSESPELIFEQQGTSRLVHHKAFYQHLLQEAGL